MASDANLVSKLVSVDSEVTRDPFHTQDPFHFPQCASLGAVVSCTMKNQDFFSYFYPAVDSTKLSKEIFGTEESHNLVCFVQGPRVAVFVGGKR